MSDSSKHHRITKQNRMISIQLQKVETKIENFPFPSMTIAWSLPNFFRIFCQNRFRHAILKRNLIISKSATKLKFMDMSYNWKKFYKIDAMSYDHVTLIAANKSNRNWCAQFCAIFYFEKLKSIICVLQIPSFGTW